jgi:small subunit ribosomal protein S20
LANTRSALKRIRSSVKRRERNRYYRSTARTYVKKARRFIEQGSLEEAQVAAQQAIRFLDKAAEKGIIHKNNAARRKSRLMRLLNQALANEATAA